MLNRYDISVNKKSGCLSIKEFAVLGRISQKKENLDPTKEEYSLIFEETYDIKTIRGASKMGMGELIAALRSDNFFPVRSIAESVAEKVIELLNGGAETSDGLFFDDKILFSKEDGLSK